MSAQGAPVPVLIGPVACIGCPPSGAEGVRLAPLQDRSLMRYMGAGGIGITTNSFEKGSATLGRKVAAVVRDPCRVDVHVSKLTGRAVGVFAVIFAMTSVEVRIDAMATLVPNGSCKSNP